MRSGQPPLSPRSGPVALADTKARITWFEEPQLLGTAGALSQMRDFFAGEAGFVVHYGDVLTDRDLRGMLTQRSRRDALLTMLVHERVGSNSVVKIDDAGRVAGFLERPMAAERQRSASPWVNSGIYACSAGVLDLITVDRPERLADAESALATGAWQSPLAEGTPR